MVRQSEAIQARERLAAADALPGRSTQPASAKLDLWVYYHRLVARGLKKGSALMAVMRKMLAVAAHLLMHEGEEYDPHTRGMCLQNTSEYRSEARRGSIFPSVCQISCLPCTRIDKFYGFFYIFSLLCPL